MNFFRQFFKSEHDFNIGMKVGTAIVGIFTTAGAVFGLCQEAKASKAYRQQTETPELEDHENENVGGVWR